MKIFIRHISVLSLVIMLFSVDNRAGAAVGASTPFISYEAENGLLGGGATIVALTSAPTNQYSSSQLEASGHAYVQLTNTGQSVTWTNNTGQNITAINIRSCIPDAPAGGGITSTIDLYVNGTFSQAFAVNSLQNYCYEGTNYNGQADKNPADGDPRGFWNDTHAFITNGPVTPGSTIALQKDSANAAAFYDIDVVDLEAPPAPLSQPANSLSILSYGAVSNNPSVDNTVAINNCFSAAQTQGMIAWIPPGTFYISAINGGLNASGITIEGAGPWYTTIYRVTPANNTQGVANIINAVSCTLENVALDCNASNRAGNNNNGAVDFSGNNWLVNNVWIQHVTSSFWCAGINGIAENCRTLSTWADGGNFNNVQSANGIGMNLTYSNNFVRGTGDDAMAINSVNYNVNGANTYYYTTMSNIAYVNNTAIGAWGGKGIGIYGGINDLVTNNLLCDTARYIGLGAGRFGVNGSDLLSARILGNTVLRCGGNGYSQQQQALMIGNGGDGHSVGSVINVYCASNTIIDSVYDGASFSTSSNIVFQYNTIINPGGQAAMIVGPPFAGSTTGNAIIYSNRVTGLGVGQSTLTNAAGFSFAPIVPVTAADYAVASGVTTEPCAEGGQDLTGIGAGDWSAYNGITFNGQDTFVARVASAGAGGNIEIHLDSPTGTLMGTCAVSGTGGGQTYVNAYGNISSTNGTHEVYLVYTGSGSELFSLEYFGFFSAPPVLSHQLVPGNTYALEAVDNGLYVTAPNGGADPLIAQSATVGTPQEFQVVDQGGGNISLLALVNTQYVCADNDGTSPLIANRASAGSWETYTEYSAGGGNIALRAMNNGLFVTAEDGGTNALIADTATIGSWQSFTVDFVTGVAPAAPNNLTAVAGNSQVALNWLTSTGATGYSVGYSTTNGGPYRLIVTNLAGTSFVNTGLTNGTTYYYVVTATNSVGQSADSSQVIATPGTLDRTLWVAFSSTTGGDSPGNALDGNLTTRWSTDTAQVSGQRFQVDMGSANTFTQMVLNSVNSPNDYPRGYNVYVSNDGINWGSPVATGAGTASITTITFPLQAARYLRIVQTGTGGNYWSIDEFNVLATVPTAPTNPAVTAISSTTASLAWNAGVSVSGYNVKRSTTSGSGYTMVASNVNGLSYTDTGLNTGTNYYYVITSTNSYGESTPSSQLTVRTVSTAPMQLKLAAVGGQLQLSWPSDHTGWRLEAQTNSLNAGLGTNWVTVLNSTATNQISVPVNSGNGAVFFRLVYP